MSAPGGAVEPPTEVVTGLVGGSVASRIAAGDTSVWSGAAWPGWMSATRAARPMMGAVAALSERFRVAGLHRIVLVTTAGVGVAAEGLGLGGGPGTGLVVLDTADPESVAEVLAGDLDVTALVVVVPPDATAAEAAAVAAVHDVVATALRAEGIDADGRTVLVHRPGLPQDGVPAPGGAATLVAGPPDVSGLWSSLSAYTLVPAGLAGIDVADVLAAAALAGEVVATDDPDNPALVLGALLAAAPAVALTGVPALVEWAAELAAGGLGKAGRGPLPVRLEFPTDEPPPGALVVELTEPGYAVTAEPALSTRPDGPGVAVEGAAAGQVVLWQHAVAVAAHLLGVEPTDRTDPAPAVTGPSGPGVATFVDGGVVVHAGDWLPPGADTVADALRALVDPSAGTPTHLAVHAYLDRESDASAAVLRPELARRTGLTTTFGWAPRCLAGTGQYDKGGPDAPLVCQLTGAAEESGEQPEELGGWQRALAEADAAALAQRGRRVLRLHLADRVAGLVTLVKAVQQLDRDT